MLLLDEQAAEAPVGELCRVAAAQACYRTKWSCESIETRNNSTRLGAFRGTAVSDSRSCGVGRGGGAAVPDCHLGRELAAFDVLVRRAEHVEGCFPFTPQQPNRPIRLCSPDLRHSCVLVECERIGEDLPGTCPQHAVLLRRASDF
eukprot:6195171-Pleurochrysis_carterae.AAC.3